MFVCVCVNVSHVLTFVPVTGQQDGDKKKNPILNVSQEGVSKLATLQVKSAALIK